MRLEATSISYLAWSDTDMPSGSDSRPVRSRQRRTVILYAVSCESLPCGNATACKWGFVCLLYSSKYYIRRNIWPHSGGGVVAVRVKFDPLQVQKHLNKTQDYDNKTTFFCLNS